MAKQKSNMYVDLLESIFVAGYQADASEVPFMSGDLKRTAKELGIDPSNIPDAVYDYRYRGLDLKCKKILETAQKGREWIIRGIGKGRYKFDLVKKFNISPAENYAQTKILDATPGVVLKYKFDDEQALLAQLRFNRLIDIFTGLTCYSLQNHLRTSVSTIGQVETDEIYMRASRPITSFLSPFSIGALSSL